MNRPEIESLVTDVAVLSKDCDRKHYFEKERNSIFDLQAFLQKYPRLYQFCFRLLTPNVGLHSWKQYIPLHPDSAILNLGCGTRQLDPRMVNVDFVNFPRVHILADLEELLPIQDASVDAALCFSVLDHRRNPELLMQEAACILKPGGVFYVSVPFVYPFHAAPNDYYRWTPQGLKQRLGTHFSEVVTGPRGGRCGSVVLALAHMAGQLLSYGNENIYRFLNHLTLAVFFGAKYLDLLFCNLPFHDKMATSIYAVAKK